jgi:hypothetical protein
MYLDSGNGTCDLFCSICQDNNDNGGWLMLYKFSFNNNQFSNLTWDDDDHNAHKNCILTNNGNLIYDENYVLEQLNIGYKNGKLISSVKVE